MIALDPTHFLGHWTLGVGLGETGAWQEAVAALGKANDLSGGTPLTLGFLAYACGRAGRRDDTRSLLFRLQEYGKAGYVPPSMLALCHLALDDRDAAFEWMDRAVEARDPIIMPIKTFPFLDPVRSDDCYRALLAKMHLE